MAQNGESAANENVESAGAAMALRVAFLLSVAVGAVACLVLVAWLVDVRLLTRITPPQMIAKANTAFGMLLLAAASAQTARVRVANRLLWPAYACIAVAALIAVLSLLEYVFDANFLIDQLLAQDILAVADTAPGRIPRITALGFITLSAALIAQTNPVRPLITLSRVLLWLTLLVAAQTLIGYVINLEVLLDRPIHTQMSLHSTGMFIGLCVAQLLAQRAHHKPERITYAAEDSSFQSRLLFVAIIVPPVVQSFIQLTRRFGFLSDAYGTGVQVTVNSILMLIIIHFSLRNLRKRSELVLAEQRRVAQLSEHVDTVERERAELYAERIVARITRENEERLQTTIEGAFDGVVTIDDKGVVIAWNNKAEKMFGRSKQEVMGRLLADLIIPQARREAHAHGLQRYLTTGHEVLLNREIEVEGCHANGSMVPMRLYITPVQVGGKRTFTSFMSDITERRRNEDELRRAQTRAEQAAAVKSQFLAHMSHEIRTPLNGILGMTDSLLDSNLDASQKQTVDILQTAGQQLLDVVNDILDFSKMEAGHLQLEMVTFNLLATVGQQVELLRSRANNKGLHIDQEVVGEVPAYVTGDPGRLSQVVLNLLSNGIKFTAAGSIKLQIFARPQGLRFAVTDSGIGMSIDVQRGLFEPFYQADSSTSRRYGGTGLGLAISRQLVELMGGTLNVTSELDRGSTFWFELPLQAAGKSIDEPDLREPLLLDPMTVHGRAPQILVVEDNEINRVVISAHLRKLGCEMQLAGNGVEAVRVVRDRRFDMILMDCHMPEMDGFEATSLIRAYEAEHHRHTPIVALTASALAEDVARCLEAGMDAHLCKPIRLGIFAKVLREHLSKA